MEHIKVLLFELDSARGAGKRIRELLEAAAGTKFELKHHIVPPSNIPAATQCLAGILADFSPQLSLVLSAFEAEADLADFFRAFRVVAHPAPVIAVSDTEEPHQLDAALTQGADDYLLPPFRATDVLRRVGGWLGETKQHDASVQALKEGLNLEHMIGESPRLVDEIRKIPLLARRDTPVLIEGESGTGKEIYARALHDHSRCTRGPFIAVNCGAVPEGMAENEFFGHESGAFTGANGPSAGLIYEANGGTLFLDEVDSLPPPIQVKFLRLLENKEYRRLGSPKLCKAEVRIISATSRVLQEEVSLRHFREDLLYRLNAIRITLPPLRERTGDIPLLCRHFVCKYSDGFKEISPAAMQKLLFYGWPGNVRELKHVIEEAVALSQRPTIEWHDIHLPSSEMDGQLETFQVLKAKILQRFAREYLPALLAQYGNVSRAARAAGKHPAAFRQLLRKYRIRLPERLEV